MKDLLKATKKILNEKIDIDQFVLDAGDMLADVKAGTMNIEEYIDTISEMFYGAEEEEEVKAKEFDWTPLLNKPNPKVIPDEFNVKPGTTDFQHFT